MEAEHNLLFGIVTMQIGHISAEQFAEACALWGAQVDMPLADILQQRGWINAAEKLDVQRLVAGRLEEHSGNARRALDSAVTSARKTVPNDATSPGQDDNDLFRRTMTVDSSEPPPNNAYVHLETVDWQTSDARSRYTLTRVHGKGGLGRVWLARDGFLNREVALKELLPKKDDEQQNLMRLIREAQITGQLEHPNIVPVYELSPQPGDTQAPFYTMRFLRGNTLAEAIREYHRARREGRADLLELRRLLQSFISICHAISYAHSRGIIHRDLKPSNILLGDFGEVIVVDWGLAKQIEEHEEDTDLREIVVSDSDALSKTRDGQVVGTPAYMAPEQADGRLSLIDTHTDIYGLGAMLFTILVGHPPHRARKSTASAQETMDVLRRISTGPTPHAKDILPDIPNALDAICATAMARRRSDRYASATELAKDVQRWLADEPVSVHRDSLGTRAVRWMRRNRNWTLSGGSALVVALVVSVVSAVLINSARQRADTAFHREFIAKKGAETARQAEADAKDEALRRFTKAREAFDKSLTGVSEILKFYPNAQPMREQLLSRAADEYEDIIGDVGEDLALNLEAARTQMRLGEVRKMIQQYRRSEEAYDKALHALASLVKLHPENPEIRLDLAKCKISFGLLYTLLGRHVEAAKAFTDAEEQLTQVPGLDGQETLAGMRSNYGQLLRETGSLDAALAELQKAEAGFTSLVQTDLAERYREGLAITHREMGHVYSLLGRTAEASESLRAAVIEFRTLLSDKHAHPPYLEGLANARMLLANTLRAAGPDDEIIDSYQACIADYEALLQNQPGVPHYRENLALARTNLAQMLYRVEQSAEAKPYAYAAAKEFDDMAMSFWDIPRFREQKAACYATTGMILRDLNEDQGAFAAFNLALEEFRLLRNEFPESAFYLRREAISKTGQARLLQRQGQYEEARELLQDAIDGLKRVIVDGLDIPHTRHSLAWCYTHMGDVLRADGKSEAAQVFYSQALQEREQLQEEPEHLQAFVMLLANCPDADLRNTQRAVELAKDALDISPGNYKTRQALALAHLRHGNFPDCLKEIRTTIEFRKFPSAADHFIQAMAAHHSGDAKAAQTSFDLGAGIMQQHCPGRIELVALRDEAQRLLAPAP